MENDSAVFLTPCWEPGKFGVLTRSHPLSNPANSETLRSASNRVQERCNSHWPSAAALLPPSRCQPDAVGSGIAQEAKARGNARDMLTWAGGTGRKGAQRGWTR